MKGSANQIKQQPEECAHFQLKKLVPLQPNFMLRFKIQLTPDPERPGWGTDLA